MITKKEFLNDFEGHGNAYSSYKVLTTDLNAVITVLNEINPEMNVGSGVVEEGAIYFEICKKSPDLIYDITAKLHCVGFADMGAWYGQGCFEAAKNGNKYDGFYAEWRDDCPYDRYEEGENEQNYDVFVTVVDRETKISFPTGEGAACTDALFYWTNLVNEHPKDKAKKLKDDFIPIYEYWYDNDDENLRTRITKATTESGRNGTRYVSKKGGLFPVFGVPSFDKSELPTVFSGGEIVFQCASDRPLTIAEIKELCEKKIKPQVDYLKSKIDDTASVLDKINSLDDDGISI